jgi:proteasome lid subunit RPN8/RPN11
MCPTTCFAWLQVTEVISELYGMSVVGWYHSHPSFPALPSVIDIANQLQMQQQVGARGHVVCSLASL